MNKSPQQISADLVASNQRKVIWLVDLAAVITTQNRTLQVHENHVQVTLSATGGTNSVLTMPDVAEAAGQRYFIYLVSKGADNELSLSFLDSPKVFVVAGTIWTPDPLTADADCILLESDGTAWFVIIDNTN